MVSPNSENARAKLVPSAEMLLASIAFATMSAMAHFIGDEIPWTLMAFCRILITFLISLATARMLGITLIVKGTPLMWSRSVAGCGGLLCTFYALTHMPVTDAVTLLHTRPIWIALILAIYFRRFPGPLIWVSVALGIVGVYLMERPSFEDSGGVALVAAAGAVFSAMAMFSLRNLSGVSPLAVVVHYSALASVVTLGTTYLVGGGTLTTSTIAPSTWLWLLPIGLSGTIGQVFLTRAYGKGETHLITIVGLSVIGFAAFYDYVLWEKVLGGYQFLGIALIGAAILMCAFATDEVEKKRPAIAPNA